MKITWYGAASILLEYKDDKVFFDPLFWGEEDLNIPVCITHGHMDHLAKVPEILEKYSESIVYLTKTPAQTLLKIGVGVERINLIKPESKVHLGDITLEVLRGKHIKFDAKLVLDTIFEGRVFSQWERFKQLAREHFSFPEAGETIAFHIYAEEKELLLLGSLALADNIAYPKNLDVLILPYQGNSDLCILALEVIFKLQPKCIILDHFDDAFPPISREVDTSEFEEKMKELYPHIRVIKPNIGEGIVI